MSVEYLFVSEENVSKLSGSDFGAVTFYRNAVVGSIDGGVVIPVKESGSVALNPKFPEGMDTKEMDILVPLAMDREGWAKYLGVEKELVDGELVPYNQDKKVVILNAPPNSGKDYFVEQLKEKGIHEVGGMSWSHKELKRPLVELVKNLYSLSDNDVEHLSSRENKEKPSSLLNGKSWREAMIFVSEEVVKPALGKDIFGKVAASNLSVGINIFTDGGFEEEIAPIVEEVGEDNIIIVKIHKDGCSFEGDSRDWIDIEGVKSFDVTNYGDESFVKDMLFLINEWWG